jgi:putative transposase
MPLFTHSAVPIDSFCHVSCHLANEKLLADNVLDRNFTSQKPGEKYATDITYIPIPNSMVYVSVILDLFNREVAANKISQNLDATLATDVVISLSEKRMVNEHYCIAIREYITRTKAIKDF